MLSTTPVANARTIKIAIIIPYHQINAGILKRALTSIINQRLPQHAQAELIVVDDGSPVSAQSEIAGLTILAPFKLTVITQKHMGVAAARNVGLRHIDDATTYIAFLDSEDTWLDGHLNTAIEALESGGDFYFSDIRSPGYHDSYLATGTVLPSLNIKIYDPDGPLFLTRDEVIAAIRDDSACRISTIAYRRSVMPNLIFDEVLPVAAHEMKYLLQLAAKATRFCFSHKVMVECGNRPKTPRFHRSGSPYS